MPRFQRIHLVGTTRDGSAGWRSRRALDRDRGEGIRLLIERLSRRPILIGLCRAAMTEITVSSSVEFSLIVGIENSLVGALA